MIQCMGCEAWGCDAGEIIQTRPNSQHAKLYRALQYNLEPTFDTLLAFVNDKAGTNRVPGKSRTPLMAISCT